MNKKVYLLSKVPAKMGILNITKECVKINHDLIYNFKDKRVKITIEEVDEETFKKLSDTTAITKFFS